MQGKEGRQVEKKTGTQTDMQARKQSERKEIHRERQPGRQAGSYTER